MAKGRMFFSLEILNTQTNKSRELHGLTLDEVLNFTGLTKDKLEEIIGCEIEEMEPGEEIYLGESGFDEYYMIYDGTD